MENETETTNGSSSNGIGKLFRNHIRPSLVYLFVTILVTCAATSLLCGAIMSDHWEKIDWNWETVELLIRNQSFLEIEWLLNKTVVRIFQKDYELIAFLVPMNGGIWTLCINLGQEQLNILEQFQLPPRNFCINYLTEENSDDKSYQQIKSFWQNRMQNLSMSCALVCLIVLGSAALVGAFGIFKHQICAVLVTGVMYFLAATFALFVLIIIHFKRMKGNVSTFLDATMDGVVVIPGQSEHKIYELLIARMFDTSWSLELAWSGVICCFLSSILWIFLSKIMRFNSLTTMFV